MTPPDEITNTELLLLRAMCQGHLRGPAATRIRASLIGYKWREPIHQVIFGALLSIPFTDPKIIRDLLPARLTLRGFPDVKFGDLLIPVSVSSEMAEQLAEWLHQNG